ncbi:MAG: DNA double-strand break repair nuclease NurA [Candidatus Obscuribacterales bacterium]|nr:DNA double-strand break repair nuclease NurA [Candidatus Obscuribacterales bacterium]
MLDFQKLIPQIQQLANVDQTTNAEQIELFALALETWSEAKDEQEKFKLKLLENSANTFWPLSIPLEPFAYKESITEFSEPYVVIAGDGSQIMPTQHEIYSCYLLNIGITVLSYRSSVEPILLSLPKLFYGENIYPLIDKRRIHVDESVVSLERALLELETIFAYALEAKRQALPVVALADGSLIPWNIDKMPVSYRKEYLNRLELILENFRKEELPLLGYISHSRSSDLVNGLRVWRCPYPTSNCQTFCGSINEEEFPCSKIWPLSDRQLLAAKLKIGERSSVYLSEATWSKALNTNQRVAFCYFNNGSEVARLEFPAWLYEKKDLFNFTMQVMFSQNKKGFGYPIALAEAHNLAVIRQKDRNAFFELLRQKLLESGQSALNVSPKEFHKRQGIL